MVGMDSLTTIGSVVGRVVLFIRSLIGERRLVLALQMH